MSVFSCKSKGIFSLFSDEHLGFPTTRVNMESTFLIFLNCSLLDCFSLDDFQLPPTSVTGQPQIFFAGGVVAPPTGIYALTPAPPGGLSSLGPRVTFQK